jgi:WD40 repeat protein
VQCSANVRAGTVQCGQPGGAGGILGDRVLGGQNVFLRLASSNVAYDAGTQTFAADITVQNLLVQKMGTDGATVSGIRVFFHGPPTATSGKGTVVVDNADGEGLFTGSSQPYFEYPGTLSYQQVSAPRRWRWSVPATVGTFSFTLYVSTPLLPVIVFDRVAGGNRDIYRVGLDGSDLVRLTDNVADDRDPTVAQGQVVFTSYRDGNAELYRVPLAGGTETRLTTTTNNESDPALSPDGTRLAFTSAPPGGITHLYTSASDGTGALPATTAGISAIEASPSWMNGQRLAYMSTLNGTADIFDLTVGGTPALRVGGTKNDVEPAWSPDGTRLVFATNRDTDTELYLQDVAGGGLTRLTTRAGTDGSPSWLADGRIVFVCYSGGTGQLCWMDPAQPGAYTVIPTGTGTALRPEAVRF